jgi:hypothetical protein
MVKKDETRPGPTGRRLKASSGNEPGHHTVSLSTDQFAYVRNQKPDHRRAVRIRAVRTSALGEHEAGHTVFGPALRRSFDIIAEHEGGR